MQKVDVEGNTPLHCAASKNSSSSTDIVNLLVKAGADLEIENKSGRTALEECVARNNLPAVKVLVRGGARLGTALSLARTEETGQEIISYLEWAAREAASSVEDEKEILLRRLSELLEKEAEEIEAKRMEKKTLLDKTRANLQNQSKKMEEEIAEVERKSKELKAELTRYKDEEEMKIKALTQEVRELQRRPAQAWCALPKSLSNAMPRMRLDQQQTKPVLRVLLDQKQQDQRDACV